MGGDGAKVDYPGVQLPGAPRPYHVIPPGGDFYISPGDPVIWLHHA